VVINNLVSILQKEKGVIKNSLFLFSTGILSAAISTTSNIIFSRFFGPAGFGIFKTSIGLASTVAYTLDFGTKYFLPRFIAEFEGKREAGNITYLIARTLILKAIVTILVLILSWIFSYQVAKSFFHGQSQIILVWPTMLLFTIIFLDVTTPILLGYQNFKLLALTSILVPFSYIIFGLPLAYIFGIKGGLVGASIAFLVGSVPAIRYILKRVVRKTHNKSFNFRSTFINYSIPAYIANVPSYISIAIIPILSLFFTQRQVGFYSLSLSFYTAAQLIPVTLSNVMFPKVAQLHSQQKADQAYGTFKRLVLIYTPFVVVGIIVIIPITEPLIRLLIPQFLPATKIIIIQTIAALLFGYFAIVVNYVTAIDRLRIATVVNWILSILFLILAFYVTGLAK